MPKRRTFKRWRVDDDYSIASVFQNCRRGIYILEFKNGERYVGQATNIVTRFSTHRHGSKHHKPWTDITAIQFLEIPTGDLNLLEQETIREVRNEYPLRNKTFNFGHSQPCALDKIISVEDQEHWATGQPSYDLLPFAKAAQRTPSDTPKLMRSRLGKKLTAYREVVADAVLDDLAFIIATCIPNTVETEGRFWTLSDFPSTAGGRFATLNVGRLELAYFPRKIIGLKGAGFTMEEHYVTWINAASGTFLPGLRSARSGRRAPIATIPGAEGQKVPYHQSQVDYSIPADVICIPTGTASIFSFTPEELAGFRQLALNSMRAASAKVNQRSHNRELTRLVYERIAQTS